MAAQGPPPIPINRLKQIANDACHDAIGNAEFYDHAKTEQWNSLIINSILKAVIAESQPSGSGNPPFKFAVNSTITDGMWTFKYECDESKGMDVIVMLIWIGI
ncbi:hypothetical protein MAPG_11108 [Magnaporthiopsis poae ATCC 64411]|uniref:Dynein light chain n=1 Tax=Magnaporthiopsis poae (strain ATCC 64411 / 73-15) TaxID=644358 RepID=A0A0C4CSK5_MAGP6|nr:hypothetical protein, variant [Magnaporthiopsis poae ATCC 64411]KLU92162.1 hypothetical protein MAPG_11108 [Magnaporthiopsis poae ATCC 64411]